MDEKQKAGHMTAGDPMPLIRCTCKCGHVYDVAFVWWTFSPESAFKCPECGKWVKQVQLFRDERNAPSIDCSNGS